MLLKADWILPEQGEFAYNKLSVCKPLHPQECKESSSKQESEDSSHPSTSEATLDPRCPVSPKTSASACRPDPDSQSAPKKGHKKEKLRNENPQMSALSVCHHSSEGLQNESDEEELEAPLPLRSEDEWRHYHPYNHMHHYGHSTPQLYHHPAPCHLQHTWHRSTNANWLQYPDFASDSASFVPAACSVSVNVPHFSVPPPEGVSRACLGELAAGGSAAVERGGLPDECRNIFITYSSDASSEILHFTEVLTKQGFRPTIDILDTPVNCVNINSWRDGFLKDLSTLIIIAISPKYKADIEGSAVDNHALQTRYIHFMMQNEFIQQGSLNFRFIPVLFLNASQEHVPSWLQTTRVYLWPQHTDDLLLRLLRKERYVPPPVAMELNVIIKPVPLCATTPTL